MKEVVIGIDIGGTFTKFGLTTRDGRIYYEGKISSENHADINDFIHHLKERILEKVDRTEFIITGIGIGAPNGNYYNGTIEYAPNLRWKGVIPLAELFKKDFSLPVSVTNDANAAAMGEMIYGDAKHMRNFIMITLGTGVGSGIVVDGKLVYGNDGFAGELGHTVVFPEGRKCACGKNGCLENYASATGIVRTAYELMADTLEESELRSIPYKKLEAKNISEAAAKGDKIAMKAFDYTGKILGMKLADAVAHTSPEAIFLFGGLAKAGDLIFMPTKKYMEKYLLKIFRNKVEILPSALLERNIAVLGAAALIWNEKTNEKP